MNSCTNKKYNFPHKNWLSLLNVHEKQWKKASRPTYSNLYAYAGNNPVRYIDPNGKKIILCGTPEDQKILLSLINKYSDLKFKIDENGELRPSLFRNFNFFGKYKSITYSLKILSAIKDENTIIEIIYSNELTDRYGNTIFSDVQIESGGGAVLWYPDDLSKILVVISPFGSDKNIEMIDKKGNLIISSMSPQEVMVHELIGHAIPILERWNGNAIDRENQIRQQLKLLLRKKDETHICINQVE